MFFGEIIGIERFLRLRVIVKDKTNQEIPIAFHTDERGSELDPTYLQSGFTVAISTQSITTLWILLLESVMKTQAI